jgi:hypothetical protein
VRETPVYLVMRGFLLSFRKGSQEIRREEERVRWIPWVQIAVVTELPVKRWREADITVDEDGQVEFR